ncbi:chemotaxis protein CheA [Oceanobacillus halotolerans]|uniref:chemotaxis protein CheA n=1 Tax=Oceanobacillus halotolerans TaxID=2663380 RepID=UPI0013D9EA6B|nr:chemotaxis protein CheA [Oceanobacillus halotolerans]
MATNQYTEVFLEESNEHLQAINDNLLNLENKPEDLSLVQEIFRSAHTLKGMAATMEFTDITSLTHQMENVLDKIRNQSLKVNNKVIDITFEAVDHIEEMVNAISVGEDGKKDVSDIISRLEQIENGKLSEQEKDSYKQNDSPKMELDQYQQTVVSQAVEQGFEVHMITVRLIEDCMLKSARVYMVFEVLEDIGEIIKSSPAVEELETENFEQEFTVIFLSKESPNEVKNRIHKISEIQDVNITPIDQDITKSKIVTKEDREAVSEPKSSVKDSKTSQGKTATSKTIRVNIERIDYLMNLFEEVVIDRGRLEDISNKTENQELIEAVEDISRVSSDMQNLILTMRMVPVEQVFNRFPRMVRGLAKDLNKKIDLEISGAETELDRTVIDEIGDPLVHLIRNSIDHGVEEPMKRKQVGKQEVGKLYLRAYHSGNYVFIEIEDDGAGINRDKIVEKAIENELITSDRASNLTDKDVHQFILSSGFSTADHVSDISGRGVGLDVVRMKIESLGGQISIESEQGQGSKFIIQLPLTLSILSTLLVDIQNETYGIPLSTIMETVLLPGDSIMHSHGHEVIDFRGNIVPLVSLQDVFNVPNTKTNSDSYHSVVIVKKGEKMAGLVVDSFVGQKEVVLKSLGNYLQNVYAISGATILGDGQVSLIIDPNELIS